MKLCTNCGAVQGDERTLCVDCGAVLGEPVKDGIENKVNGEIAKKVSKLSDNADALNVSLSDKILGVISVIAALILIATMIYTSHVEKTYASGSADSNYTVIHEHGVTTVIDDGIGFNTGYIRKSAILGIIFFSLAAVKFLLPGLIWSLTHFRLSFLADGELVPSKGYKTVRRLISVLLFALGCLFLADVLVRIF